jgi:hypothetical protein
MGHNCLAASVVAALSVSDARGSGELKLLRRNVDRRHLRAKGPSDLHCKVSQATYAENGQALTGHNPGALLGAINCKSGTKKQGSFERRKTSRNFQRPELPAP